MNKEVPFPLKINRIYETFNGNKVMFTRYNRNQNTIYLTNLNPTKGWLGGRGSPSYYAQRTGECPMRPKEDNIKGFWYEEE